jgi:hypothetical protein
MTQQTSTYPVEYLKGAGLIRGGLLRKEKFMYLVLINLYLKRYIERTLLLQRSANEQCRLVQILIGRLQYQKS